MQTIRSSSRFELRGFLITSTIWFSDLGDVFVIAVLLDNFRDGDAFATTELVAALAMVDNHGEPLLDLVAETFAVVAVEVFLVLGLIFVTNLEETGEPPWGGNVDVALGATDDEVAFGLNANTEGE